MRTDLYVSTQLSKFATHVTGGRERWIATEVWAVLSHEDAFEHSEREQR